MGTKALIPFPCFWPPVLQIHDNDDDDSKDDEDVDNEEKGKDEYADIPRFFSKSLKKCGDDEVKLGG